MSDTLDFSFDDGQWVVRDLVVDASGWLECRAMPVFASPIRPNDGPGVSTRDQPACGEASHWRSCNALTGYRVHALDGDAGLVQDLLVDAESRAVHAIVIDTRHWWTGHSVLIAPEWVTGVRPPDRSLSVGLTRDAIQRSLPYELNRWRVAATRTGDEGGPPIEDEVQRGTRPSVEEAANILIQKSWLQGESVPAGQAGETDVQRLRHFGFEVTTIAAAD
ncbi:hypothetical protein VLK31_19545 [Variovorax sp. H27-G14]|uniref:hypothetical protein n=1 Tax=Variovorax sp. H27-G14 TaxID=3111914 RepID=UPI0038FD1CE1